ncbi:MAG: hypothetical protein M3N68_08260, partial [Actinomycetota bacterium]|nr:hypothetical protein [Actinomycetota bacterium]
MNDFDDITGRLRKLAEEPIDAEVAARHLRSFSAVEAVTPPPRFRFRPAVAGGILAGALLGGTGLAGATGHLGPLQDEFHAVSAAVGVRVPEGNAGSRPADEAKDYAAEAEQKAAEAQRKAQEATEAALRAGETAREAQQEASRVEGPSSPPTTTVLRFYGTAEAPCTIPVIAPESAKAGDKEKDGAGGKEAVPAPQNPDEAKNAPRVPFIVGTHEDYVRAHPPALREEAARSDCGKPLSEVKQPPTGGVPPPGPPAPPDPAGASA